MDAVALSLILPAYNEAPSILKALEEAQRFLASTGRNSELIVVDDGSTDQTSALVQQIRGVRLIRFPQNRGYGAALRAGFEVARGERVAFTDADVQFHLEDFFVLLASPADVALAYRVGRQDPWMRKFLSRGYNWLARHWLGTGVRDVDCAMKVFRRQVLSQLLPVSTDFFANTEMLIRARRLGLTVAEFPVRHRTRFSGTSKVGWSAIPRTFRTMARFWWTSRAGLPENRTRLLTVRMATPRIDGRSLAPLPGRAVLHSTEPLELVPTKPEIVAPVGNRPV
jgi:dolichol-phosphate mannosyltransferase